jgi:adenine-specific DNA methylase
LPRRLIEEAFPLKKVSEDAKHEKNVRHGHISTLHIWPARRPLAACRAAIIAALLPDPGDPQERENLCRRIANITHWGTENGPDLEFFRQEIRKAYSGRAPRVLDMFAGGGAIPLEAMRLGCEVTAIDYNPVAWFILKCTLEYPQRLAGEKWPLPKSQVPDSQPKSRQLALRGVELGESQGDLAAHVRWWGNWVLERARQELAPYYPTVNGQPTVAYLWARTIPCPDPACGAEVPLLETLWLCKKKDKRRALRLVPDPKNHRVNFEVWTPGPKDEVPPGTMAGAKSTCPCCGVQLPKDYIKRCAKEGKLGAQATVVVVDTPKGKEYRLPTAAELKAAGDAKIALPAASLQIPYGLPDEPLPGPETLGFRVPLYGFKTWADLFTPRQLLALTTFVIWARAAREEIRKLGYPREWAEILGAYLALMVDKLADRNSQQCIWISTNAEKAAGTFGRFALPIIWDFVEIFPWSESAGGVPGSLEHIVEFLDHATRAVVADTSCTVQRHDAAQAPEGMAEVIDAVVTDPPYYDAIPYADISDFFYVWLRRTVGDQYLDTFRETLTPKRNELVQHSGRFGGNSDAARKFYEDGMATAFKNACDALAPDGRMVIVFAHKDPNAWETLTSAIIRSGFAVTASWPLDTERVGRVRAQKSAALASSIWLVCRKRPVDAGTGRYAQVKRQMQERISERLRYFWDQGISGPNFVWAAVGPALESYSQYREVRRMDGSPFTVSEFLREVRRQVTDFALSRILGGASTEGLDEWTRYYLLHRQNFGPGPAPVGECILLAQGYGLDLNELRSQRGFLQTATGSNLQLLDFTERNRPDLGEPHPSGSLPMIDALHRLMRLWAAGEIDKVTAYTAQHGLGQNDLFWRVAQAVLEMAAPKSKERTLLEALVAWGRGRAVQSAMF